MHHLYFQNLTSKSMKVGFYIDTTPTIQLIKCNCLKITQNVSFEFSILAFCTICLETLFWPQALGFQKLAKMHHFWHYWVAFLWKWSSLRSQCWMRLFEWFSNTVDFLEILERQEKLRIFSVDCHPHWVFGCDFWRQMVSQMLPRSELKGSQITPHLDWIE